MAAIGSFQKHRSSLALQKGRLQYEGRTVLFNDLTLTVEAPVDCGRLYGLVGENGAGKTSLLDMLAGRQLQQPTLRLVRPTGAFVEYLPQPPLLLEHLNVWDNICVYKRIGAMAARFQEWRARRAVELLNVADIRRERVDKISMGQRQRVCIARALAVNADIVLLDEPTTSLDPTGRRQLLLELRRIAHEERIPVVVSTHEPVDVLMVADTILTLSRTSSIVPTTLTVITPRTEWPVLPSRDIARLFAVAAASEFRRTNEKRFACIRNPDITVDWIDSLPPLVVGMFAELASPKAVRPDVNCNTSPYEQFTTDHRLRIQMRVPCALPPFDWVPAGSLGICVGTAVFFTGRAAS